MKLRSYIYNGDFDISGQLGYIYMSVEFMGLIIYSLREAPTCMILRMITNNVKVSRANALSQLYKNYINQEKIKN